MPTTRLNAVFDAASPPRVDRAKRMINGVSVATIGTPIGRKWRLTSQSLDDMLALAQAGGDEGVTVNVTHADSSDPTQDVGTLINFRRDGDKLRADLRLSNAAKLAPGGDRTEWLMARAEENPKRFGLSANFNYELDVERDDKGNALLDANGKPLKPFARIKVLNSVDVVGKPAANPDGLLAANDDDQDDDFASRASTLFDSLGADSPQALLSGVEAFLSAYCTHRFGTTPDALFSKGSRPMDAARQTAIAALCAKHFTDANDAKTFSDQLAADDKVTAENVSDALLALLASKSREELLRASKAIEDKKSDASTDKLAAFNERRTQFAALLAASNGNVKTVEILERADKLAANPLMTMSAVQNQVIAEMSAKLSAPKAGDDLLSADGKKKTPKDDATLTAELSAEYDQNAKFHASLGLSKEDWVKHELAERKAEAVA